MLVGCLPFHFFEVSKGAVKIPGFQLPFRLLSRFLALLFVRHSNLQNLMLLRQ